MKLPTASELPRVVACPSSAVLPRVEHHSANVGLGNVVHAFLAEVPSMGRAAALERVDPEYLAFVEAIDTTKIHRLEDAKVEVALAYNMKTGEGRVLGTNRSYELSDRTIEYVGTVDRLYLNGSTLVIGDYKTGYQNRPPAAHDPQLWLYAIAAARAFKATDVLVECIHLPFGASKPKYDRASFDALALDLIAVELNNLARRIAALELLDLKHDTLPVAQGNWCEYCPALPHCPATKALLAVNTEHLERTVDELAGDAIVPARAAEAYRWVKNAKRIVGRMEEVLKALAAQSAIPLGDGLVYGRHEVRREAIDAAIAYKVLEQLFGLEAARAAVSMETSKTAIENVVKPLAKDAGVTIKSLKEQVLKEIAKQDGISGFTMVRLEEHKPRVDAPPAV